MKRGGTAGGSSKKDMIQVTRPVPKFLQGLKYQNPEEEVKLEDKFNNEKEGPDDVDDYDVENAQVLNDKGEVVEKKEENKSHENTIAGYYGSNNDDGNQKVDINTFHPTFKTKKPAPKVDESKGDDKKEEEERDERKQKDKGKDKEREKEKERDRDRDKGNDRRRENKKEERQKEKDSEADHKKRSIDQYIKGFLKEDKNDDKKGKIKSNLLSFGDDE